MRISDWSSDVCSSDLRPLTEGPFYAMPIYPGDIGTNGGLRTDDKARVVDGGGKPIAGLYAIGNNAASAMGESYPGAGRSEERRGGKECVSTCRSRWSPDN